MVISNINRKNKFTNRSIYIPERYFGIDKELNDIAMKDKELLKAVSGHKGSLVSFLTILLWKKFIYESKHKEGVNNETDIDTSEEEGQQGSDQVQSIP